ncbi:MAG: IS110 family transposase [Verrucomicrobia bacterium]|jgi:transposase|nr:IS110 family transposase [Verrucomicrobiota bacterium]
MINYILRKPPTHSPSQTKRYGVVKLTQDVHAHFYVSCLQEEGQPPKAPRKLDPQAHLEWVAQLVARSEKVYSCYEAGPTGFALHRQLTELGVENIVVAPTCLDEQGRRVNNDKTDTLQLAGRLDRYVAGNKRMFSVVRVPTLEQEQRRAWTRQRKQLQAQRLSLASQGRSLVLTQGVAIDNLWWQESRWKRHLGRLASWLMEHLEVFRKVILVLDEQIEQIDKKIQAQRKARAQSKPKYAGDNSLEVIEAEVGDWNRFGSWRKAGSYCGLTGGVSASGQSHCELSITKRGNRRLRTALIEMAWRLALHQPDYWLTKKWAPILNPKAKAHRRSRKKAIVAYARALFVDLWKWKTGRITVEQLGWQMC